MTEALKKYYSEEILKRATHLFSIPFSKATLIRGNNNLIFDCGDLILRLTHSTIRSADEVAVELDWLQFLKTKALPVVQIIPSQQGKFFEVVEEARHYFTVVCFEKIEGTKITKDDWNPDHFEYLGNLAGQLHRVGQNYQKKAQLAYRDWDTIAEFHCYHHLPKDGRQLGELHDKLVEKIRSFPIHSNNYGLIHYDIHHGNYLLTKGPERLLLFDFEMTCQSWFVNDISALLYYACSLAGKEPLEQFEVRFMEHFWKGYEKEWTIDPIEKTWIPYFLLYRDLLVYGFVHQIWKEKVLEKGDLRFKSRVEQSIQRRRAALALL